MAGEGSLTELGRGVLGGVPQRASRDLALGRPGSQGISARGEIRSPPAPVIPASRAPCLPRTATARTGRGESAASGRNLARSRWSRSGGSGQQRCQETPAGSQSFWRAAGRPTGSAVARLWPSLVSFFLLFPITMFGLVAGSFTDRLNRARLAAVGQARRGGPGRQRSRLRQRCRTHAHRHDQPGGCPCGCRSRGIGNAIQAPAWQALVPGPACRVDYRVPALV